MMVYENTRIAGVKILTPAVYSDHRGFFLETYNYNDMLQVGIDVRFVQDNESYTKAKHTLRGMHYQKGKHWQAKLVRVLRGAIFDVIVDLRKESSTYLQWVGIELTEENRQMVYLPRGCAHGFLSLTDDVLFQFKVDNAYCKEAESGFRYDDPLVGIKWPTSSPIVLQRDLELPTFKDGYMEDNVR